MVERLFIAPTANAEVGSDGKVMNLPSAPTVRPNPSVSPPILVAFITIVPSKFNDMIELSMVPDNCPPLMKSVWPDAEAKVVSFPPNPSNVLETIYPPASVVAKKPPAPRVIVLKVGSCDATEGYAEPLILDTPSNLSVEMYDAAVRVETVMFAGTLKEGGNATPLTVERLTIAREPTVSKVMVPALLTFTSTPAPTELILTAPLPRHATMPPPCVILVVAPEPVGG